MYSLRVLDPKYLKAREVEIKRRVSQRIAVRLWNPLGFGWELEFGLVARPIRVVKNITPILSHDCRTYQRPGLRKKQSAQF